jgi:beta-N-acetylhexosaminidase
VVVACTLDAGAGAGGTVAALAASGKPVVAVALGAPYDLGYASRAAAALATYSSSRPSLDALAGVLAGRVRPSGKLPVAIPKPGGGTAYRPGLGLRL